MRKREGASSRGGRLCRCRDDEIDHAVTPTSASFWPVRSAHSVTMSLTNGPSLSPMILTSRSHGYSCTVRKLPVPSRFCIMPMLHTRAARPDLLQAAGCGCRAAALTGRASLYAAAGARKRPSAAESQIARTIRSQSSLRTCKFALLMWEGYTTAHRTRVRHMRHARLEAGRVR